MAGNIVTSVADLIEALRQSRLLEPPQLDELVRSLQPRFTDPKLLARELMQRGWLTPYQVNQLFQGGGQDLVLGRYVLLERLGEGGMGQVFKARHKGLDRIVALKVIRKQHLSNTEAVRRFRREIEAAAKLAHLNVVAAYDADEVDGNHFFAMEYVDGIDLSRLLKQQGVLSIEEACDCIRQAALGLQHAHERGLVHRDIKPGNLLLSRGGGQGAGPRVVKILDMGLVRLLDAEEGQGASQVTQARRLVGTADYMAPEQALNSHEADIRADLYSLGCTFYHLLTGRPPFPGGKMMEKLLQHQRDEPPPVEQLRPEVPPEVGAIVRKLMAKRAADRYQTPAEVAQALAAIRLPTGHPARPVAASPVAAALPADGGYPAVASASAFPAAVPVAVHAAPLPAAIPLSLPSEGEVLTAVPLSSGSAPRRRKPWMIGIGAAALLVLITGLVMVFSRPGSSSKHPATTQEEVRPLSGPPGALQALLRRFNNSQVSGEELRREVHDLRGRYPGTPEASEAIRLLVHLPSPLDRLQARTIAPTELFPSWQPKELVAVMGEHAQRHWGTVNCVASRPDGRLVASGGNDWVVRLWDVTANGLREAAVLIGHNGPVYSVAFSPGGEVLASAGQDRIVRLWDVNRTRPRELVMLRGHLGQVHAVAFSPDGKTLASASTDGSIRLWDPTGSQTRERQILRPAAGESANIHAIAFAPNSQVLASAGSDRVVRLWDLSSSTPRERTELKGHPGPIYCLAFAPDGRSLVSGGNEGIIKIWDLTGDVPQEQNTLKGTSAQVRGVAFAPNGKTLVSVSNTGRVRFWDLTGGADKGSRFLTQNQSLATSIALLARDNRLVTGGLDCTVRVWDLSFRPQELGSIGGPLGPAYAVRFAPDGQTLACGGGDQSVRLWDLGGTEPKRLHLLQGAGLQVRSVAFAPNGKLLVSAGGEAAIRLWDLGSNPPRQRPELRDGSGYWVHAVAVSPDGKTLASGGQDWTVRLWDLTRPEPRQRQVLKGHKGIVWSVAFSPDGKTLASGSNDYTLRIWDVSGPEAKERAVLRGHNSLVTTVVFSPDGKLLASAGGDSTVRLWDLTKPEIRERGEPYRLRGTTVQAVTFSPDGNTLAAGTAGGTIARWGVATGQELQSWEIPGGAILGLTYAPDGRHLVTANGNGTIYVLRLAPPPSTRPTVPVRGG